MASIRRFLPSHLASLSTIETLCAIVWRSRTIALQLQPDEVVRLRFYVNARHKFSNQALPVGYYGNVVATAIAISTVANLVENGIEYALELVKETKNIVTEEYMKSLVGFIALNGRPHYTKANTFSVSNVRQVNHDVIDFGWGPAVRSGPARAWVGGPKPGRGCFFLPYKNSKGKRGALVPMYLPPLAMEMFVREINGCLGLDYSTTY